MDENQRCAMDWYLSILHQTSEGNLAGATMVIEPAIWHIFQNHQSLMTEWERQTTQYLALCSYADASTAKIEFVKGHNKAKKFLRPEIEELLKNGEQAFLGLVRDRILHVHGYGILNLCPRCGTLARTAQAKQCHKCFYNWRDQPQTEATPLISIEL